MAFTPTLTTPDFDQLTVAIGTALIDGFGPDEAVRLERLADTFLMVVGADGKVSRTKTSNDSARLTLTLLQGSASNDVLDKIYTADKTIPNGAPVPLFIRDRGGRSVFFAAQVWIVKGPDVSFGTNTTMREWIIDIAKLESNYGGN